MPFKFSYYILTILHKYGGGKKVTHNLICFKKKGKKMKQLVLYQLKSSFMLVQVLF